VEPAGRKGKSAPPATLAASYGGRHVAAVHALPAATAGRAPHGEAAVAARREMPDLGNATLRDALVRLRALGVEVDYTGEGRVVGQEPAPGTALKRGARA